MKNLMRNLGIPNMITETKKLIIAEIDIKKTMHTSYGDMDIVIARDCKGEYEPQLLPKYQNTVTQDMEEKLYLCMQRK